MTLELRSVTFQPPSVTLRPPSVTLELRSDTLQPPSVTFQPPSVTLQPLSVTVELRSATAVNDGPVVIECIVTQPSFFSRFFWNQGAPCVTGTQSATVNVSRTLWVHRAPPFVHHQPPFVHHQPPSVQYQPPFVHHQPPQVNILAASRQIAVAMILAYVLYIVFTLVTHKDMFEGDGEGEAGAAGAEGDDDDEDEGEEPHYTATFATVGLAVTTVLISFMSEFLVNSLEPAAKEWGLSTAFISVILLPIVGNAAEHATAIVMAYKVSP